MKKKEGFEGQRSVVLPQFIITEMQNDPVSGQLYVTDIGYYPNARLHQRVRKEGCNQYILIYCTHGEGWFSVAGKKTRVQQNQFFIIPKETPHAYASSNRNPWSIYWVHFSGSLASHFYDSEKNIKALTPSKNARTEERIQLFEEIIQNLEMGYSNENLQYANICLMHFLASFCYINQFRQIRMNRENDPVENSIFFMKENMNKKISLDEISAVAGLSISHFSLLFRKKTGRSPVDYLIHFRIQKACHFLDNSDYRINEIAAITGYDDPYYFSRLFKKVMGISPENYRNMPKG